MGISLKTVVLAVALLAGTAGAGVAYADGVTVSVDFGNVAFAYADGYWDRDHHWHAWRDAREAAEFRREHRDHYYAWHHDRDHDHGWHDADRWWDKR